MYSMYEKIMSLPLFKGITQEMVEYFIEKTPLLFTKFKEGDIILKRHEKCNSLKCLITGKASITHYLFDNKLEIIETIDGEFIFGSENLFGIDNKSQCCVRAVEECSVMEFTKKDYLKLLHNNNILLLNYLNFLSRNTQKFYGLISEMNWQNPIRAMIDLIQAITNRDASRIEINSREKDLAGFLATMSGIDKEKILSEAANMGVSIRSNKNWIISRLPN